MARREQRRSESLRRRSVGREPRRRILIVCEGAVTEAHYFDRLRMAFKNRLVKVEIDPRGGKDPTVLVRRAVEFKEKAEDNALRQRDDFLRYDEVWCVFDVDEHPHLHDARQQARDNGIDLAVSNPCFELWALLHFQAQTAHLERGNARSRLKRHLPEYDKALPFERVHSGYSDAVTRAQELERRREDARDPGGNPSTGVYRLTERIREGGRTGSEPQPS